MPENIGAQKDEEILYICQVKIMFWNELKQFVMLRPIHPNAEKTFQHYLVIKCFLINWPKARSLTCKVNFLKQQGRITLRQITGYLNLEIKAKPRPQTGSARPMMDMSILH